MRCRTLTLAGTVAVLAGATFSAPALAADRSDQSQPTATASGLLDGLIGGNGGNGGSGLGGLLGGLLGGNGQQPLQNLLGLLQGGQAPTARLLEPVQRLLDQLLGTPGLPPATQSLIEQVRALLASGGSGPLPGNVLLPVATLLRDLAGTQGVPAEAASLLRQLADLLDGDGAVPGLPVELLELPPALIAQLGALLQQLENGGEPTGTLLAPVSTLLDQVAGTEGLPPAISQLLSQLGSMLANTTGALDPLLASQLSIVLRSIAGTPGVSTETRTILERISTLIAQPATASGSGSGAAAAGRRARTATARDRAVVKRIRVNRARTRIGVRVACPRSAPATCATVVRAAFAGRKAAQGKRVRIGAGRSKVVRLRMVRTARTSSVNNGGRLRVRVTTAFGAQRFAHVKAVRLKPTAR